MVRIAVVLGASDPEVTTPSPLCDGFLGDA
jgi:hypothetical protein